MPRTAASSAPRPSTATRILDVAERLAQTCGFNGFSYADISAKLGITKASLHHHFASKAELGRALILRYSDTFGAALDAIDKSGADPAGKLDRYVKLYYDVLRGERLCLCGMFAAEYSTLPRPMQEQIRRFFDTNEAWLARVIGQGRRAKIFHARGSEQEVARMFLSALEGAMLVARPYDDAERFTCASQHLLAALRA